MTSVNKPIVSISSSGECPRAMSARLLGREEVFDAQSKIRLERAAKEGTRWEAFVLQDLRDEYGYTVIETPYCEPCGRDGHHVELDLGNCLAVGHIDGFAPPALIEVKTMSRFQFDRWRKMGFDGFRKYAFQVSLYMLAMNSDAVYAVKNRDTGELNVQTLTETPFSMAEIVNYLSDALRAYNKGEIAECPQTEPYPCGFCYLNLETAPVERSVSPEVPTEVEIAQAIQNWRSGKAKEREGLELINGSKDVLLKYLDNSGQKSFKVDGVHVTQVQAGISRRMDTTKLKLFLGSAYSDYEVESVRAGYVKIEDELGGH